MATRVLDQQFAWEGVRSSTAQRLEWPRDGLLNDEGDLALDPATIPERLQDATAEFARLLIDSDTTVTSGVAGGAITALKAGSVANSNMRREWWRRPIWSRMLFVSACRVTGTFRFARTPRPPCRC